VEDINELLTDAMEVYDIKTLKEIVHYSTNFYMLSSLGSIRNNVRQNMSSSFGGNISRISQNDTFSINDSSFSTELKLS
jgi:hypothetical protein